MSEKRLFNAIRRIAILQMLSTKEYTTSKILRETLSSDFDTVFYDTMENFRNLGWIEVMEKDGDFAGDDRREYKLTNKGEELRERLLQEIMTLLGVSFDKNKEDSIKKVLTEFSYQWKGKVEDKILKKQVNMLKLMMKKVFKK